MKIIRRVWVMGGWFNTKFSVKLWPNPLFFCWPLCGGRVGGSGYCSECCCVVCGWMLVLTPFGPNLEQCFISNLGPGVAKAP